jgi:hypothetical protein
MGSSYEPRYVLHSVSFLRFFIIILQLIGSIFRKSLRLSGRARLEHSVGQITTMISTDTSKFDELGMLGHQYVFLLC